jgi:hypothetical protein
MEHIQADLFTEDNTERNQLTDSERDLIRERLAATLAWLEATAIFPWSDPLDATHEENRFQRATQLLGEEGLALWARFDREMDRLHATLPEAAAENTLADVSGTSSS